METAPDKRRSRKGIILLLVLVAGFTGLLGGAIGGAAGAVWVVETMAKPRYSPKVKNAVIDYDMPEEGARPVDIAGIKKAGTPLNSCLIGFLEDNRDLMPHAKWEDVRLAPYFKSESDIITEMAFARGAAAITRRNEIIVRIPDVEEGFNGLNERLFFHELAHIDQYASGRMDLPDYAASAATAYAAGRDAHDNTYEQEAEEIALLLVDLWKTSEWRKKCHPDLKDNTKRADSERPIARYAIFDRQNQEYRQVEHKLHATSSYEAIIPKKDREKTFGRSLIDKLTEDDEG